MSDPTCDVPPAPIPSTASVNPPPRAGQALTKLGATLGMLGCILGMLVFVLNCFGLENYFSKFGLKSLFSLGMIPLVMAVPGLLFSLAGGSRRNRPAIDPTVMGAVFLNVIAFAGAMLEIIVWQGWGLFYATPG